METIGPNGPLVCLRGAAQWMTAHGDPAVTQHRATGSSLGVQIRANHGRYVHAVHPMAVNGATPVNGTRPPDAHDLEDDRARLAAQVEEAKQRLELARQRLAERELEVSQAVRDELTASRQTLASLELGKDEAVRMIRAAAAAEVERMRSTNPGGDAHGG